jgi:hypothetical protein
MIRVLAMLALMVAVAIVAKMPGPVLKADRNRGERHEQVSIAALAGLPTFADPAAITAIDAQAIQRAIADEWAQAHLRYVGGLAAQAAPAAIAPDPTLTPGAVRSTNVSEICSHGTRQLRHWDRARDDQVIVEYGLRPSDQAADRAQQRGC